MYKKKKKNPVPFEFGLGSKTEITNYAKAGYLRRLPYPLKQIILFLNEYFVHAFEFWGMGPTKINEQNTLVWRNNSESTLVLRLVYASLAQPSYMEKYRKNRKKL